VIAKYKVLRQQASGRLKVDSRHPGARTRDQHGARSENNGNKNIDGAHILTADAVPDLDRQVTQTDVPTT